MSSHNIPLSRPLSAWNKPLKFNFKEFFRSLTKAAAQGAAGKADGAIKDSIDALSAISFGNDYGGIAWTLILKSLLQAIETLKKENESQLIKDPANERVVHYQLGDLADDPDSLLNQLDWSLEEKQLAIDEKFFLHPRELPILGDVQRLFAEWLKRFGLSDAQARVITDRLPSYFVYALNDQWRHRSDEYKPLEEAFNTPFTKASRREQGWFLYSAWLQRQIDEKMFDEAFSLRQVYVPLRAFQEQREGGGRLELAERRLPGQEEKTLKEIFGLEEYLQEWLNRNDANDAVKVVSGGPGSGKSSFAKMFAAHQSERTERRVLFIPLHKFDPAGDLSIAVGNFVSSDQFLAHNPLDPKEGDPRLLIIFDGLDELSEKDKAGAETAQQFVAEVRQKVAQFNHQNVPRLKVIISGRELVVQANASEFRRPQQIVKVLPYLIQASDRENYTGDEELINRDQRSEWWKYYGEASGKPYEGLPEAVNRDELLELTSQPLLNYLIAYSLERGKINISTETNINNIYRDLLDGVYDRRWEHNPHPATKDVSRKQFARLLEEVAVAVWHGDGRKTTMKEIVARLENTMLATQLDILKAGAEKGVTNLLMAFYFRQAEKDLIDDATFEFTHKSFSEYLAARRIVGGLSHIHGEMERRRESGESGYDERAALEYWLKLCGPAALDTYIFNFIRNEMLLQPEVLVMAWQDTLIKLIEFVLRNGMPMEKLIPRPTFQQESKQARNSEESLLCLLNICATQNKRVSDIKWPSPYACGEWLARLVGQRGASENNLAVQCLSYLNLKDCVLEGRDLIGADFTNSNLEDGSLVYSNLTFAQLEGANLKGCRLFLTDFDGATLRGATVRIDEHDSARLNNVFWQEANLSGQDLRGYNFRSAVLRLAQLEGTNLEVAILIHAFLDDANLKGANLKGAILTWAQLTDADLTGANLERANLENSNLSRAKLNGANLENTYLVDVVLSEASLQGANLKRANLIRANLRNADLEGANLDEADLRGANLVGIKVSDEALRNDYLRRAKIDASEPEDWLSLSLPEESPEG